MHSLVGGEINGTVPANTLIIDDELSEVTS
jgi:hypothetical protein